ncbi:MAG: peptidase [Luteitalea sp.]|nr:peptidase [Luteitalea sp.]
MRTRGLTLAVLLLVPVIAAPVQTQQTGAAAVTRITSPREQLGFDIGDDYMLATYSQLTEYWKKLDRESDRMTLVDIGRTAEGRSQWMAIITAPENHQRLPRYKEIARRLARAEALSDEQARQLAAEGKAVVWIDGGLHATETLGAQQLMQLVYEMVSRTDPETMRLLRDVILLAAHANPDGHELVANWYMREQDPKKRSLRYLPRLYQKYAGHDNNRDSYMVNLRETENINRILFREWFPQIMYNHHQSGPDGTVLFAPPFRDPFNYVYDPLIPLGIDLVGAAMHTRFVAEGKPGATMRRGASYSTWWNGGLRTTVYFHNMIGLLTETIGSPTPMEIPFVADRQLPSGDLPYPISPQKWHFRQSIEYSLTANRAVLDVASRHREQFLYNIYRMGRNSIDRGSRDHWTRYPRRLEAVKAAQREADARSERPIRGADAERYAALLRDPARRDPRGYILPADQPDFLTAIKFANALIKNGVEVQRATSSFTVDGKTYPAGSLVVQTAQAFRPHVLDMFEPQDHPNDFRYPGGPPIPPYDSAGWTLAYQMGVGFDRILDGFDGPFERISDVIAPPPGAITGPSNPAGYLVPREANDSVVVVNRLLKAGDEVFWVDTEIDAGDLTYGAGAWFIPSRQSTRALVERLAREVGVSFHGLQQRPTAGLSPVRAVRIGLWDQYGGSMDSGWVRFILERFEFPFEVVYPPELDAGGLAERFDALIFVDGALSSGEGRRGQQLPSPENIPAEFHSRLGRVTLDKTVPQLQSFLESGGTIVTIGSSTSLAAHLGLPLSNALVERDDEAHETPLSREKFYVPGSVLRVAIDRSHPLAAGFVDESIDVYFDNNPVFRLEPAAPLKGVRPVAWFDTDRPLRSGWAWGQEYLQGGVAAASAPVGNGQLFLFGPEITFRAQPHGTFKLLFNAIYLAGIEGRLRADTD